MTTIFRTDALRLIIEDQGGMASNNRFRVHLPNLAGTQKADGSTAQDIGNRRELTDLCTSARIPGKTLSVVERNVGMEQIKVANGYTLGDMNLTFYLTNAYTARKYFQEWMDCIVSPEPPYTAGFHSNYSKSLTVTQLDRVGDAVYTTELIKAYPTSMAEIDLNNQAQTAAIELTVSLTYSNYLVKSQSRVDPNDL
jgi:hypothetical protein|tara:strand:+ start:857 stop:1444 length:588 start_codon:yes stop_codon:yes gene_type:complete